ncbi:CRTAC1 family protein [Methyloterricola oryzae]|uniref:CRTAC1 family protein n=1 Tax=Methyloterricola oryzae TaxID=1495050 RepID=UPI000A75466E|nr:CRTAC1 family protein [Methyloterricola oryzae]
MRQKFHKSRLICLLLGLASESSLAAIAFEDVTEQAGIRYEGFSYAAAWGDFNGDGWPDLWAGNHENEANLFVNQRDGRFRDEVRSVVTADLTADKHAAAWADFDNDGDQDLMQTVGAVSGTGQGPKQLMVNDRGMSLRDEASKLGVDWPLGRGRNVLWFDADVDGRLDLLLLNAPRPDGQGATVLLQQRQEGFQAANEKFGLALDARKYNKIRDMFVNLLHWRWHMPRYVGSSEPFAQIAGLSAGHLPDLAAYGWQSRFYALGKIPFDDITDKFQVDLAGSITDAAIADFNGDGRLDLFFTHGNEWPQWSQPHHNELWLSLSGPRRQAYEELSFHNKGPIRLRLQPYELDLGKVFIGPKRQHPEKLDFSLGPEDFEGELVAPADRGKTGSIAISYDAARQLWTVRCAMLNVGLIVQADDALEVVGSSGFEAPGGMVPFSMVIKGESGYQRADLPSSSSDHSCLSAVAADFDNDMDVDLYAVCTGPARQEPNLLLENDGKGHFTSVPGAGGAEGGEKGRGDVALAADYDRDGFLDLFVANGADKASPLMVPGPDRLFRNRSNGNHWIELDLQGRSSNRDGIGSHVEVHAGGVVQMRDQGGGIHRFAQDHQRLHFGLAGNTHIDRLTVRWPSGIVQELKGLGVDRVMTVVEPAAP